MEPAEPVPLAKQRDLAVLREPPRRAAVDLLTTVPRKRGAVAAAIWR